MIRVFAVVSAVAALMWAPAAAAQTQAAGPDRGVGRWHFGVTGGPAQVERDGIAATVELGGRLVGRYDIVVEGGYIQDVVTRGRLRKADDVAAYLQRTLGEATTARLEVPAWHGTVGVRRVWERAGKWHPYVLGSAGIARVEAKPVFTTGTTERTISVTEFGVTMGRDLIGTTNKFTYGGRAGVLFRAARWYVDVAAHVSSILTETQAATVRRVTVGFGRRF